MNVRNAGVHSKWFSVSQLIFLIVIFKKIQNLKRKTTRTKAVRIGFSFVKIATKMTLKCVRIGRNKQRVKEMVMPTISFFCRPLTDASAGICA